MQKHCHRCGKSHTKLGRCQHCGEYFCEEHLPAKMCLTRAILDDKKLHPSIRAELEREWRKEDGHPDAEYTSKMWKKFERKEKEYHESVSKFLDASKTEKPIHVAERLSKEIFVPLNPIKEKSSEKLYKPADEIWEEVHPKKNHHSDIENKSFRFPSIKVVALLVIIASIAVLYSFAPTETKDNISSSFGKIASSISSAKDNIAQTVSTNIVSLNQETSIADISMNATNYLNKNLTVRGTLEINTWTGEYLQDGQGYNLPIECDEGGRTLSSGATYIAKGVIKDKIVNCFCQSRKVYTNTMQETSNNGSVETL